MELGETQKLCCGKFTRTHGDIQEAMATGWSGVGLGWGAMSLEGVARAPDVAQRASPMHAPAPAVVGIPRFQTGLVTLCKDRELGVTDGSWPQAVCPWREASRKEQGEGVPGRGLPVVS